MLIVLVNWIVMCAEWLLCGNAICLLISKLFSYQIKSSFLNKIIAGYIGVSIYAQLFSALDSLGINANLILLVISVLLIPLYLKYGMHFNLRDLKVYIRCHKILFIMQILLFAVFLVMTATPVIYAYSGDMGFYHAQFIHWLEEYGAVCGLTNLTMRFGTCGASFYTCALYSWNWLIGVPLRCVLPFLWMVCGEVFLYEIVIDQKRTKLSHWLKITFLLITMLVFLELDTYSSVHISALISYVIIIKEVELLEKGEQRREGALLLAFVALFNITIKLTVVPLVLLGVLPAVRLFIDKKVRQIFMSIGVCLMITIPFFINNVLISGYILFPQVTVDIFDVAWKFPRESVLATSNMIKTARKIIYAGLDSWPDNGIPLSEWFPQMLKNWFSTYQPENVYVINTIYGIMIILLAFLLFDRLLMIIFRKTQFLYWQIEIVLFCGVIYCLFLSPAPQYLMWCLPMFFALEVYIHYDKNGVAMHYLKMLHFSKVILVSAWILGITYVFAMKAKTGMQHDFASYLVKPGYCYATSDNRPIGFAAQEGNISYDSVGFCNVYYPTQGSVIWYEPFPGVAKKDYLTNNYGAIPRMRGETLNEGFYAEVR